MGLLVLVGLCLMVAAVSGGGVLIGVLGVACVTLGAGAKISASSRPPRTTSDEDSGDKRTRIPGGLIRDDNGIDVRTRTRDDLQVASIPQDTQVATKECPACAMLNPIAADRCLCGHDFRTLVTPRSKATTLRRDFSDGPSCDRCNRNMKRPEGYLFFAAGVGNMLLCESCTDGLFAGGKSTPRRSMVSADGKLDVRQIMSAIADNVGTDGTLDVGSVLSAMSDGNNASILDACARRGLNREQAKAKARELGRRWWENRNGAQREAASFWTGKPW